MSNVAKSQADTEISRVLQFLQTIHKKFCENRQVINQINSKECVVYVK